MGWLKLLLSCC